MKRLHTIYTKKSKKFSKIRKYFFTYSSSYYKSDTCKISKIHLSDHSKMAEQVDSINIDYVPNTLISLWPLVWFSLQEPAQQSYRDNSR